VRARQPKALPAELGPPQAWPGPALAVEPARWRKPKEAAPAPCPAHSAPSWGSAPPLGQAGPVVAGPVLWPPPRAGLRAVVARPPVVTSAEALVALPVCLRQAGPAALVRPGAANWLAASLPPVDGCYSCPLDWLVFARQRATPSAAWERPWNARALPLLASRPVQLVSAPSAPSPPDTPAPTSARPPPAPCPYPGRVHWRPAPRAGRSCTVPISCCCGRGTTDRPSSNLGAGIGDVFDGNPPTTPGRRADGRSPFRLPAGVLRVTWVEQSLLFRGAAALPTSLSGNRADVRLRCLTPPKCAFARLPMIVVSITPGTLELIRV
jgi:hypothetical protein